MEGWNSSEWLPLFSRTLIWHTKGQRHVLQNPCWLAAENFVTFLVSLNTIQELTTCQPTMITETCVVVSRNKLILVSHESVECLNFSEQKLTVEDPIEIALKWSSLAPWSSMLEHRTCIEGAESDIYHTITFAPVFYFYQGFSKLLKNRESHF